MIHFAPDWYVHSSTILEYLQEFLMMKYKLLKYKYMKDQLLHQPDKKYKWL